MTEQINDIELEENAFDEAVADIMGDDTDVEDTDLDEGSTNDDESDDDVDDIADDDTDIIDDDEEEQAAVDYKALYDQMTATNASLQGNLADATHKLASWEGRIEAARREAEEAAASRAKEDKPDYEMTPELEDILDEYPDLIPQVQALINQKVTKEVSGVEERVAQLIEQRVKPIATHVQESETQAHNDAIFSAHPDVHERIEDGSLKAWIDTLPKYQQVGAYRVCNSGSAQEVISLFDSFKDATSTDSAKKSPTKKNSRNNKTVDKLKGALATPSDPTRVSNGANANTPAEEDPEKLFAAAAREVMREELGF
jgi:hypothetical protein